MEIEQYRPPSMMVTRETRVLRPHFPVVDVHNHLPAFWGGAFGTFLLRQYFLTIPRDLLDAARLDGATLWDIFWRVYMPLAKPAIAALAIFTFKDAWNALLHSLVYLPSDMHPTTLTGVKR